MNPLFSAFSAGLLFALGLGVSGMTNADKVIGFLNLAGDWDPSLAFVMVGAIGVHLLLYRTILKRKGPLFADRFHIPTRRDINPRLVGGAALFGIGWGLGGTCPGPGLISLMSGDSVSGVFVLFMVAGMLTHKLLTLPERSARVSKGASC